MGQWRSASPANRLATAADWTVRLPAGEALAKSAGLDAVKPRAAELVVCMETADADRTLGADSSAPELAAMCASLMGWGE